MWDLDAAHDARRSVRCWRSTCASAAGCDVGRSGGSNDDGTPPRPSANAGRRSFLDDEVIALASLKDWSAEEQGPYTRYVAPYKGFLYQRLGLDKTFVRGEGCYLFDAERNWLRRLHRPVRRRSVRPRSGADMAGAGERAAGGAAESGDYVDSRRARRAGARLLAVAPPGFAHVVFTNSGAESVEAAIKLARCRTGRPRDPVDSQQPSTASRSRACRRPTRNSFSAVSARRCQGSSSCRSATSQRCKRRWRRGPSFFAAFMVEIIQGESGIRVAPPGYLAAARGPVPPAWRAAHRRRGADRARQNRKAVRLRGGRRHSRYPGPCQGARRRPDADRRVPLHASAYTEQFDLRHGSTFAGNTLACRAALATIDELTKDDRRLVRQVAAIGDRLQQQLRELQSEYPALVKEIRGRGLMLGVELDLWHIAATQNGMLAMLQEQGLLLYIAVSYLLNVEHIRIAPSFTHGTVLRIEPPLIADAAVCDH